MNFKISRCGPCCLRARKQLRMAISSYDREVSKSELRKSASITMSSLRACSRSRTLVGPVELASSMLSTPLASPPTTSGRCYGVGWRTGTTPVRTERTIPTQPIRDPSGNLLKVPRNPPQCPGNVEHPATTEDETKALYHLSIVMPPATRKGRVPNLRWTDISDDKNYFFHEDHF